MEDYGVPKSSSRELRNFKRGAIWKDMLREIGIWEREAVLTMRDPKIDDQGTKHQDLGDVRFVQGGLDIIEKLKNLLDAMIDIREAHEETRDGD